MRRALGIRFARSNYVCAKLRNVNTNLCGREFAMIHPLTLIKGAGLGAGMMYFFDPIAGSRRRSLIRDQFVHVFNVGNKKAGVVYRDASNRLEGAKHELSSAIHHSDQGFVEKVQEGALGVGKTLGMQGQTWSPTAKAAAVLGGAGLLASLMNKTDLAALALGAVGLTFVAKEIADQEAMRSGQRQRSNEPDRSQRQSPARESRELQESDGREVTVPADQW
jgi:hypothetical protein